MVDIQYGVHLRAAVFGRRCAHGKRKPKTRLYVVSNAHRYRDRAMSNLVHHEIARSHLGMDHVWADLTNSPFEATTLIVAFFQRWAPGDGIAFNATQWSMTRASTTTATATGEGSFPTSITSITCPGNNSLIYTTIYGKQFIVECYHDYSNYDLTSGNYGNMASCIEACAIQVGCLAGVSIFINRRSTLRFLNSFVRLQSL